MCYRITMYQIIMRISIIKCVSFRETLSQGLYRLNNIMLNTTNNNTLNNQTRTKRFKDLQLIYRIKRHYN